MFTKLATVAVVGFLAVGLQAAPAHAAVQYVKACPEEGAGYLYIPGTSTCLNMFDVSNAVQEIGQMSNQVNQLTNQVNKANEGVAIGFAMPAPFVPEGKTFAVSANWGNFQGSNALALGAVMKVNDSFYLTGGVGVGTDHGTVGSRAGVMFAW
jgi:hypothetical protein